MSNAITGSPIPLSEIESVLAWVDTFKLSRPTKKICRDFSDAVLLAEILAVHYPKLVEMHNYPPRNSQSLKLNNWSTLNRKVLRKLRLNLCNTTMEQLSNSVLGVIERVLVMVRDKIRRDEDLIKSLRESEQNQSSGGSYYEACGGEENVLVVPVKTRVNGVLETINQKVVSYDVYINTKSEYNDAKSACEVLKQKVEHLESMLKLKEDRINELQKQLDRKQTRRKESEVLHNSLKIPFDNDPDLKEIFDPKISAFDKVEENNELKATSKKNNDNNEINSSKSSYTIVPTTLDPVNISNVFDTKMKKSCEKVNSIRKMLNISRSLDRISITTNDTSNDKFLDCTKTSSVHEMDSERSLKDDAQFHDSVDIIEECDRDGEFGAEVFSCNEFRQQTLF